jgi:hypothetical protein
MKERALRPYIFPLGHGFCVSQHGFRDVGERYPQRRTDAMYGTERHQTLSGTDIHEGHAVCKLRAIQHPIRVTLDDGLDDSGVHRVVRVTTMQEPFGPHIRFKAPISISLLWIHDGQQPRGA